MAGAGRMLDGQRRRGSAGLRHEQAHLCETLEAPLEPLGQIVADRPAHVAPKLLDLLEKGVAVACAVEQRDEMAPSPSSTRTLQWRSVVT